ncbi:glycosyltransferase family 2 protein [Treponema sp. R6D11]
MTFSIIIPVYKTEKFINDCVKSVLSQSFSDYECILVDDGSPDNCPLLCDEFSKKDNRIKVIHKENGGLSDARNIGIQQSKGNYIIFLDSDDKLQNNDTLNNLYEVIQKYKTDVIVNVNIIEFSNDGKSSFIYKFSKDIVLASPNEIINEFNKTGMYFAGCFFLLKKDYLVKNNLFFKKGITHEDEHWMPRVLFKTREIAVNHYPFYSYRVARDDSITSNISAKKLFDLLDIINDLLVWSKEEDNYTKEGCLYMQGKAIALYYDVFKFSEAIKHKNKKAFYNIHKQLKSISKRIPNNFKGKYLLFTKIIGLYNTEVLRRFYIRINKNA